MQTKIVQYAITGHRKNAYSEQIVAAGKDPKHSHMAL
jgi:hypothetical protein